MQGRAFRGWHDKVEWSKRMRLVLARTAKKIMFRSLYKAWEAWTGAVESRRLEDALTTKEQLVVSMHACVSLHLHCQSALQPHNWLAGLHGSKGTVCYW